MAENGEKKPYFMGCYGIGVSRIVAATIEQHHDERGIQWPLHIAPYMVHLLPINDKEDAVKQAVNALANALSDTDIDVLLDDRKMGAGAKFAEADLMGMPIRMVISPKTLANQEVEVLVRGDEAAKRIPLEEACAYVHDFIKRRQAGLAAADKILRTSASNDTPSAAAALGTKEVLVIPGMVLTSSKYG